MSTFVRVGQDKKMLREAQIARRTAVLMRLFRAAKRMDQAMRNRGRGIYEVDPGIRMELRECVARVEREPQGEA